MPMKKRWMSGSSSVTQVNTVTRKPGTERQSHPHRRPSKKLYPDYYEIVPHPIALNPIRRKIEKLKYDDMLAFELDLKQLFDNARLYNAAESLVYADAVAMEKIALEKLGKTVRPRFPTCDRLPCFCARPA